MRHDEFMLEAIGLATDNVKNGGGPFGAVIVKDGAILARGVNRVTDSNDPTAHAEVMAIRNAASQLQNFDLSGCVIYTSCEPCPMCLGAIYWSRLDAIYYGNNKKDAAHIGFDDAFIYEELDKELGKRTIPCTQLLADKAISTFEVWTHIDHKIKY